MRKNLVAMACCSLAVSTPVSAATVFDPVGDFLPSTGADPLGYGFNLWPRTDLTPTNLPAISDFAPENALLNPSAVPEPSTWLMLLAGFGLIGSALRSARRQKQALSPG